MLGLVRDAGAQPLLLAVREYLVHARPTRIPHAWHEYEPDEDAESAAAPETPDEQVGYTDLDQVAAVLFELSKQLASGGHKKYGRIAFRRFELARWLMKLRLVADHVDNEAELKDHIRSFERARRKRKPPEDGFGQVLTGSVPPWARIVLWLIAPFWLGWRFRLGPKYRWFLRQSYLAPHDPGTFLGFAQRLTGRLGAEPGRRTTDEDPGQLLDLLVNAFLEDVRRAYRRGWWRPRAARRTTYTVILLDRITRRNGGYRLLETVNRIRNETGLFDPLLFISGSRKVPPDALPLRATHRNIRDMSQAVRAYEEWKDRFADASRTRQPAAWYLPIQSSLSAEAESEIQPPAGKLKVPAPPMWSRATVLTTAFVVLALAAGGVVISLLRADSRAEKQWSQAHCDLGSENAGAKYLVTIGNECIGSSDEPLPSFNQPPDLLGVQQVIAKQNDEAEKLRQENPGRQFVTVAYISEMSAAGDILSSEVERLQGIAARQRRQLDGNVADPLVRILFVNAGHEMRQGQVAANMLGRRMADDESIIGAVGLAVSSKQTVDTIKALGSAGIPMIAAPLTADNLQNESPLYYQVSPQNRREAQVAARYTRNQLGVTGKVVVVSADNPEDFYGTSLTADALEEFGREGFAVEPRVYTPSPKPAVPDKPSPRDVGQRLCGTDGLVFYTGRPADFAQLLDGINGTCSSAPPAILAGDDLSRYVADSKSRERFPQIPFDYVALALGGQNCYSGGDLNNALKELFPERCASLRESYLTDDAPTAYDALTGIVAAVNMLRGTKVTPGAVWHMITRITGSSRIDGASGIIDFGREGSQIPLDKFLAVMRVQGAVTPQVRATCGEYRDRIAAVWCP
jgi:hypothetical protein